ncbi:MAG TPA: hypothetical protein VE733_08870 [Streptosporangiaceae bacterium]|nr:hypothetical protein [Streptosporangiaceae bacterium]
MPQVLWPGRAEHLAEDWVAARALQVLAGHARQAAHAIGAQARKASLTDDQRSGADAAIRYLTDGDFDAYWRFHLTREHQRVHPALQQEKYDLTA